MKKWPIQYKSAAFAFITLLLVLSYKKISNLAKAPTSTKPCLFTYPSTDGSHTLQLKLAPQWLTQKGGYINDASCLNRTPVYGIQKVTTEEDIKQAIIYATENNIAITPGGQRHSMGGQSFARNGLALDMRSFNAIVIDEQQKIAHVQSGATWEELQKKIDPLGLSVQAMQSINIFTIGGTISVNAHGIAHNPGPVGSTIRSMRIMLPDGSVVKTSPTEHTELFRHVIGGYGLFGIILDAEIQLVDNELYEWNTDYISYTELPEYFKNNIQDNSSVRLFFARLSMSPLTYLSETAVHVFTKTEIESSVPPLTVDRSAWPQRLVFNLSKTGGTGRWLRWNLEKHISKKLAPCSIPRNDALIDPSECLIARNQSMYDSMPYLKNKLNDTDILQEYFIPPDKFIAFVNGLKNIVETNNSNLLNVTIRYVHKDEVSALPYAKEDMFAIVLYFNQHFNTKESQSLQATTKELVELAIREGGTYYLPYQLYYSPEQLHQAYPEIEKFTAAKKKFDPHALFTNTWFETYLEEK